MKRTISINLGGFVFNIDEDAFQELKKYLDKLNSHFKNQQGGKEIIADIEARMAELLKEKLGPYKEVITLSEIRDIIQILGYPEDMEQETPYQEPLRKPKARLYRNPDDRILGGVCSGIAAYLGVEVWIIRLIFVIAFFVLFGTLIYLILWLTVPEARTTAEKLEMRGEPVNINNIKDSIKREFDEVINKVK